MFRNRIAFPGRHLGFHLLDGFRYFSQLAPGRSPTRVARAGPPHNGDSVPSGPLAGVLGRSDGGAGVALHGVHLRGRV